MSASSLTRFNRQTFRRRVVTLLWQALPGISLFLLMLPASLPKYSGTITEILPPLPLLAMFYWGLARPDRLGFPLVFIAGLLQDALMFTPFGSSALLWVLLRYVVMVHRKDMMDQGFIAHWLFCSLLLASMALLQWIVLGYYVGHAMPAMAAAIQCVMGILFYPAMHAVLYRVEHLFYRRYWYILQVA